MKRLLLLVCVVMGLASSPAWGGGLLIGSGVTGAAPSYSDNFNRSNETPITGNWTIPTGAYSTGVRITTNRLSGAYEQTGVAYWNANSFANNQFSELKSTTTNASIGPGVRITSGSTSFNGYFFYQVNSSIVQIVKYVEGVYTLLGDNINHTAAENDVLRIEVNGTKISCYINGSLIGTRTDSSLSSGNAGVYVYHSYSRGDDWSGGDL